MPAQAKPINLLPATEFEQSGWGKFLQWAVSSGRYIIIATEIVVILAFLSRFKLDQDLSELNSTIEGQKALLVRQQPLEEEFRFTQARLDHLDIMMGQQVMVKTRFDRLLASLPAEIKLTGITFKKGETAVVAITLSEEAVGEFLARLKQDTFWRELEMTDFSTTDGSEIKFKLIMRS